MSRARTSRYLGAVAAAAALAVVVQSGALGAGPLRITEPVRVTNRDVNPTRTWGSPTVLIDPDDPLHVFAASVEMRTRVCHLFSSQDGGQTWARMENTPALPSYPFCFHTSGGVTQTPLAWGRDGTLYYALAGWDTQDGGPNVNMSALLARSPDLGKTWETVVARDNRGKQGPETENTRPVSGLAVDSRTGTDDIVYVAYRRNVPRAQPSIAETSWVVTSTDGGKTFGGPVSVTGNYFDDKANMPAEVPEDRKVRGNFGERNPLATVDDEGNLYVLWYRVTIGITPSPNFAMYLSKSTDRGKSFTVHRVSPDTPNVGAQGLAWSPQGGAEGTLHVVYHAKLGQTQGDSDIIYQRSTDGGQTWSEQQVVSDDIPTLLRAQFNPNLSVAPDGRVDVVWWDFRDDPGTYSNDVYYTYSTDNGRSWAKNIRVTDRSINRLIGPWSNGFDMRQPPGIASNNAFAMVVWDDTRNGDEIGQAQDIYGSAVQFAAVTGGLSNTIKYVLAGLVGVAVVGLILLVVAMARGPRAPAVERRAQKNEKVQA